MKSMHSVARNNFGFVLLSYTIWPPAWNECADIAPQLPRVAHCGARVRFDLMA